VSKNAVRREQRKRKNEMTDKKSFWKLEIEVRKQLLSGLEKLSEVKKKTIPDLVSQALDEFLIQNGINTRPEDPERLSDTDSISKKPLVFEARNGCLSLKGEYLLPTLYDRVIQPGDKVEGWIVAQYPKGIKYSSSMGEMRVSLLADNRWIASKTFNANPPAYDDRFFQNISIKDFYMLPLDGLITENNFR
jgi:hypothetical protein